MPQKNAVIPSQRDAREACDAVLTSSRTPAWESADLLRQFTLSIGSFFLSAWKRSLPCGGRGRRAAHTGTNRDSLCRGGAPVPFMGMPRAPPPFFQREVARSAGGIEKLPNRRSPTACGGAPFPKGGQSGAKNRRCGRQKAAHPGCHPERPQGAEGSQTPDTIQTRAPEILRFAQDDKRGNRDAAP